VINTDEMVGALNDSIKCSLTALVLVSLILALAFADPLRPLCAVISLLVGLSWSFAFAALTLGTLNLLTVHFATILVGLCATFAIQLLSHYQDLRGKWADDQHTPRQVLEQAVSDTGPQTLIGAVTTAVAFWSLHFTNFRAAGELGLITGTGVLLTFLAIWTLLPVLLDLTEGDKEPHPLRIPGFAGLGRQLTRHPRWVLAVSLGMTLYSLTWMSRVPFNYNLLSLQAPGNDAVRVEHLLQSLGYSSLYAVTTAPSLEAVDPLAQRLETLPSVAHVESVANLLPRDVEKKREAVTEILDTVQRMGDLPLPQLDSFLSSGEPYRSADQLLALRAKLQRSGPRLERLFQSLPPGKDRDRLLKALSQLKEMLLRGSPGPMEAGLRAYEERLYQELQQYREFLATQRPTPPDVLKTIPEALRTRSVSPEGNFSLRIFPRANIWEREPLQQFVTQLREADPHVTGTPLLIFYYLEELRLAYSGAGRNALLVIAVLLLLHYRSLTQAALALFPKLLGVVWMIGLMGAFGQSFNAANFLALPITLGIGLVFGVNILSECRAGGVSGLYESATGGGVFLSGLVATVGFASFMLAEHVGVASFGFVMAAGVGANMLTSLGTLPALLEVWGQRRSRQAQ
jgi:predicted RND superfamily exporter protein